MSHAHMILSPEEVAIHPPLTVVHRNDRPLEVLLVEDAFGDALLMRVALDAAHVPYKLSTLRLGNQVLPYLEKSRSHMPDVILLDLGLPGMDGFEILASLAENPLAVRSIPIVILTGHRDFEYIQGNYPLCIIDYVNKPCDVQRLRDILMRIRSSRSSSTRE